MEILIINNAADYEKHYQYKRYLKAEDYPEKYPCLLVKEDWEGGLMGSCVRHSHVYLNDPTISFNAWYCGFVAGMRFQKAD
jgi:hypothetical protein